MDYLMSVIVPIFNVEPYIKECLESLLSQDLTSDIEFILIDDASTDKSLTVAKNIMAKYTWRTSQIKVITNKANIGLVETRKKGLEEASGRYVIFCDSDDWIDSSLYSGMLKLAIERDADIVGCDIIDEYASNSKRRAQNYDVANIQIPMMLNGDPHYSGSLCTRLIKRDFMIKYRPDIPSDITMLEDLIITLPLHLRTNQIAKYKGPAAYHYRHRSNSITTSMTPAYVSSKIKSSSYIRDLILDNGSTIIKDAIHTFLQNAKLPYIYNIEVYDSNKWKETFPDTPLKKQIGFLPFISCILETIHLSYINKLIIKLRKYVRG